MNKQRVIQAVLDKIVADWTDKGKLIEGGFAAFVAVELKGVPDEQIRELRKAYMLGAQHLFASIMGILDPGNDPTERDMKRMNLIHEELEAFRRSLVN